MADERDDAPDVLARVNQWVEEWRAEGRREVLREIAKIDEWVNDGVFCAFCDRSKWDDAHKPTCLWLQAQAVKDAE